MSVIDLRAELKHAAIGALSRAVHFCAPSNLGWTPKVLAYLV